MRIYSTANIQYTIKRIDDAYELFYFLKGCWRRNVIKRQLPKYHPSLAIIS